MCWQHTRRKPMARAFLGLGSNLGDRRASILSALELIGELQNTSTVNCSSIYETEPWGIADQPKFLNCVCELETELSPEELLADILGIEQELGRFRTKDKFGPREIDIDILLYDELVEVYENLRIPHPRMHERRFVLAPLCEIAPDTVHPEMNRTMLELLEACPDTLEVKRYSGPPDINA